MEVIAMSIFDSALNTHAQSLEARSRRVELLAQNIANADTPNYKARDLEFKKIFRNTTDDIMQTTHGKHMALPVENGGDGTMYRVPFNVAFDGNTVELNVEQAQYGKAAAEYQATVNFLQDEISGLRKAMRGE
jgi:flagellar basal-body rod protein FlgB